MPCVMIWCIQIVCIRPRPMFRWQIKDWKSSILVWSYFVKCSNCVDGLKKLVWPSKKTLFLVMMALFSIPHPWVFWQVYFPVPVQKIIDLEGSDISCVSPDHKCQVVGGRGWMTCCVIFLTAPPSYNIFKMVHNESHDYQSPLPSFQICFPSTHGRSRANAISHLQVLSNKSDSQGEFNKTPGCRNQKVSVLSINYILETKCRAAQ